MTKPIRTYEDLMEEKERLNQLLAAQKELVRQDFIEIKEELAPVRSAISMVGKFATKDNRNFLLTTAADTVIELVVRRMVLAKAGWFTKLVVPFFMKNFSSHVIADNKDKILDKLSKWFGKKNANGKSDVEFEKVKEPLDTEEED
ncbi:hypothetical protein [Terrimonas pollutisoli]|uniref:hypothetical protein n=1 Tax=Terrimonas pollutisoli TaxID=3034147 RepID=UPI0023EBD99C|nr:hypothetical protein [Terrimonas sp. H1YJ31]